MYYVYVLRSKRDEKFYIGHTGDLHNGITLQNQRKTATRKYRVPFDVIYCEGCVDKQDALRREQYLKSIYGHRFIRRRLQHFLEAV
jgi:putative endonuclease